MTRFTGVLLLASFAWIHPVDPCAGQSRPDDSAPLPLDSAITYGKLENGLTYYIRRNLKPEHRAEVRLVVNAGSVLENNDQRGLAHFSEHMAFNGTKNFKRQELVDYLQSVGVHFGPELNAYTYFDETVYMMQVPTDTPSIVEKAFDILEDWAHQVSFEDTEIDKERGVIIEEWRLGRGAGARMLDKQLPVLLKGSRYADRLTIGTKEILESFPHETLRQFYRDWYRPDLMAVVAVGDFDPAAIRGLITKHFSAIPRTPSPRPRAVYPVPDHTETLYAPATDPEATSTSVALLYKTNVQPEVTALDYRTTIVEGLYNMMLNDRLREISRKADPPFLYAGSSRFRFVRTKEFYQIAAVVKENGIERGLAAALTEAVRVKQHGFTTTELERAKREVLRSMERAYNERDKTESVSYAGEYGRHFLEGEPSPGIAAELDMYRRFLPGLTLPEVNALAGQWMTAGNRVITVNAPEKAGVRVPTREAMLRLIDSVDAVRTAPYVDEVVSLPLVPRVPAAGTIAATKEFADLGITEWRLSNGVRVVLKPTDFKNDEVLMSAFSPGGNSLAADREYIPAATAASVIQDGGLGSFDQIALQKLLAGKIAGVSAQIGELDEGLNGSATPQDLETLFQLVYLRFTAPRKDSSAFVSQQVKLRAMLENRNARPESAFEDTVGLTMAGYHPRRQPFTVSTVDKMNLDASLAFYRDRFADASDFTFVFVGAFSPEKIKPLVLTYLGGLPAAHRKETWRDIGVRRPTGAIAKEVHAGIEPKSQVRIFFTGPFTWSIQNRNALSSLAEVMRIKLREAIREEKGGTYGVSVGASMSRFPREEYTLTVAFGCAPERVNELVKEVNGQIDSLKTYGPDPSYTQKVRELSRRERETSVKQNRWWLGRIYSYYWNQDDLREYFLFDKLVDSITPAAVKAAAVQYLGTPNVAKFVMYPKDR